MKLESGCRAVALCLFLAACGQTPPVVKTAAPVTAAPQAQTQEIKAEPPGAPGKLSEEQVMAQVNAANSVFFPAASTQVDAAARQRLAIHAERLKAGGGIVTLHGYTDHLGSPSYNLAIAEQRVNAVAAVLRSQGVGAMQIRRNAIGSERVPTVCRSAQCRRLMRRVELVFEE